MHLDLKITVPSDVLPNERELAQVARRAAAATTNEVTVTVTP